MRNTGIGYNQESFHLNLWTHGQACTEEINSEKRLGLENLMKWFSLEDGGLREE
jgi:hypothetical protein